MFRPQLTTKLNVNDPASFLPAAERLLQQYAQSLRELQNPPVFRARRTSAQAVGAAAGVVVVQFDTVDIDSHGWWDATNHRYVPREFGYYLVTASVRISAATAATYCYAYVYKTAAQYEVANVYAPANAIYQTRVQAIVECNGGGIGLTQDYIDIREQQDAAHDIGSSAPNTTFAVYFIGQRTLR